MVETLGPREKRKYFVGVIERDVNIFVVDDFSFVINLLVAFSLQCKKDEILWPFFWYSYNMISQSKRPHVSNVTHVTHNKYTCIHIFLLHGGYEYCFSHDTWVSCFPDFYPYLVHVLYGLPSFTNLKDQIVKNIIAREPNFILVAFLNYIIYIKEKKHNSEQKKMYIQDPQTSVHNAYFT